jgi:hypothetical protein
MPPFLANSKPSDGYSHLTEGIHNGSLIQKASIGFPSEMLAAHKTKRPSFLTAFLSVAGVRLELTTFGL